MLLTILALGTALRVTLYLAYRPALASYDTTGYLRAVHEGPLVDRPWGYSAFLKGLWWLNSIEAVTALQHLMGLALAVAGYLVLIRRGVGRRLAALATVPVALDARHLVLEHFLLAETLFTFVLAGAVLLLVRRDRPGALVAAGAGALAAYAGVTRTVGLPIAGLFLVYLLVRRVGWRPVGAFLLAFAIPLVGYLNLYHARHGVYAFGQFGGRFLYARTATFADCGRLELSDRLRILCPEQPVSERPQRNDAYIWTDISIAHREYMDVRHDPYLNEFARAAVRQQPLDYAIVVLRETAWHFAPSLVDFDEGQRCLDRGWQLPVRRQDGCNTGVAERSTLTGGPAVRYAQVERLRPPLRWYSRHVEVPGPVLLLGILAAVGAAAWRPRRRGWADGRDALLFAATGLGLLVVSVATSMYDPRYAMPSLFFIGIGAVLGVHRFLAVRAPAPATEDRLAAVSKTADAPSTFR